MSESEERETQPVVTRVTAAIEDAVKAAVDATTRHWDELPGARARRLRRLARNPLSYLFDVLPEARQANPREIGIQTIDVSDIAGTAVGPPGQRSVHRDSGRSTGTARHGLPCPQAVPLAELA